MFNFRASSASTKAGYITIFFIFIFVFFFNLSRFFEFKSIEESHNGNPTSYHLRPTRLRLNTTYSSIIMVFGAIFNNIIPMLLLIFFNFNIILAVRERSKILARLNIKKVNKKLHSSEKVQILIFRGERLQLQMFLLWSSLYSSFATSSSFASIYLNSLWPLQLEVNIIFNLLIFRLSFRHVSDSKKLYLHNSLLHLKHSHCC